VFDDAQLLVIA